MPTVPDMTITTTTTDLHAQWLDGWRQLIAFLAEHPEVPVQAAVPAGPIAPHGCDDCCAEPGEPHAWSGCPGAATNVPAEAGGETVEDAEVAP